MGKDLRDFLRVVKEAGPDFYVEVRKPVKPDEEVSTLLQKLAGEGRFPVVYYPRIEGSSLPLVANLAGTYQLHGLAYGIPPQKIGTASFAGIFDEYRRLIRENAGMAPRQVPASEAPVKEVVLTGKDVDLGRLPITKHAELDSGRYIDIGVLICKDPDTGIPNAGVYRHEVKGKDSLGFYVDGFHNAFYITRRYAELDRPMEVVISNGHHPAVEIGSQTVGPIDLNELEMMGRLLGEPLEVVPGETVDLPVPARAEIAIEGVVDCAQTATDGPFGDFTGYYGEKKNCYLIRVTAITMRRDAIYRDLDPAHPEHNNLNLVGREANLFDRVRGVVPTVKAVHYGCLYGHSLVYISIKKLIRGEAKRAAMAALSADVYVKYAIVVDDDIDVYNEQEVLWAMGTRVRPDSDITIIPGTVASGLDPTSHDETGWGRGDMNAQVIIDATKPVGLPFATRVTPRRDLWAAMKLDDYVERRT